MLQTKSNTFPAVRPVVYIPWWRRRKNIGAAIAVVLAALIYCLWPESAATREKASLKDSEWITVKRGDFEIVCREEGELRPVKVTAMQFMRDGKVGFLLPEGTNVKKGDKVIGLETTELEEETQHLQEDVAAAERNLAQQQQSRALEVEQLNSEMQSDRARVEVSRLKVEDLESHPLPQEKAEAENMLASADVRLTAAQEEFTAYSPLYEKGFGNRTDLETRRVAVEKAKVEQERAKMKAAQLQRGAKEHELLGVRLAYEQAKLDLNVKQIANAAQIEALNTKVKAVERSLGLMKRRLDRRKQQLEQSFLHAPHDGIVVYRIMDYRGVRKVEIGERVGVWWSPIELPNYDRMKVRTQVPESFIRKIRARTAAQDAANSETRPGSSARVMVKTVPGRVYEAEVTWIDGWSRDRNSKLSDADVRVQGLSGVNVFDVEVELKESDTERLREGFRAMVEFPVDVLKNVITIPVNAVIARPRGTFVRLYDTGALRKVKLGDQCMDQVVVLGGLETGERVAVPRVEIKPEQPSTSAANNDAHNSGGQTDLGAGLGANGAGKPARSGTGESRPRSVQPGGGEGSRGGAKPPGSGNSGRKGKRD